jgi:hypothetical protein
VSVGFFREDLRKKSLEIFIKATTPFIRPKTFYIYPNEGVFMSRFLLLLSWTFLASTLVGEGSAVAMNREENLPSAKRVKLSTSYNGPLLYVFELLSPKALSKVASVSKEWETASNSPTLWKKFPLQIGLNPADIENSKFFVTCAFSRELVNRIIPKDKTEITPPNSLEIESFNVPSNNPYLRRMNSGLVLENDPEAIERKFEGLTHGTNGYEQDLGAAFKFNERLVVQNNPKAIWRKIDGLTWGWFGYKEDKPEAHRLNEELVAQDNADAIERKVTGFTKGSYGYPQDLTALREFNEIHVAKMNPKAIERKIKGFILGEFGYEKNSEGLKSLLESLVAQKDPATIEKKVTGLLEGQYGYAQDLIALREFNEILVGQNNPKAIARNIEGRAKGRYGYPEDPTFLITYTKLLTEE